MTRRAHFGSFRMASRAPNDTPHRVGARSYPKTPNMRLYGFLSLQGGINPVASNNVD